MAERKKFQGQRSGIGVYDDWICGDDGVECVVPSPKVMHDKFTAERHNKILEELDKYKINLEYKPASIEEIINNIIKKWNEVND